MQPEETVPNGLKRSRFSLRFNTHRVRHWILVQLVRVPVQTEDAQESAFRLRGLQTTVKRLVDDYMVAQFARRLV